MKNIKIAGVVILTLFFALQLIQPEKTNPKSDPALSVFQQTSVPVNVAGILQTSCRDCHTHNTIWPRHSYVSPVSWFVNYDVRNGRSELNLSLWGEYEKQKAWVLLDEICKQVSAGHMPPGRYLLLHRDAKLDDRDKTAICGWTESAKIKYQE